MNDIAKPTDGSVLVREDHHGVTTLTLNRPNHFNALSNELLDALILELDRISGDETVRAVVLAARGKAFCAGHDLKEMRAAPEEQTIRDLFDKCGSMMLSITRLPKPVIARVHGIATAAGCQLVATCDLAVAANTARFAVSGVNLGLFCSTPMVALTRNVPRKKAMEMLLTGEFISANAAEHYGLINHAVAPERLDEAVADLANEIARKSPLAVKLGKQLFYRQLEAALEVSYEQASEAMTCNMMAEDAQHGIDAFIAKRPMPEWKGR